MINPLNRNKDCRLYPQGSLQLLIEQQQTGEANLILSRLHGGSSTTANSSVHLFRWMIDVRRSLVTPMREHCMWAPQSCGFEAFFDFQFAQWCGYNSGSISSADNNRCPLLKPHGYIEARLCLRAYWRQLTNLHLKKKQHQQ